MTDHPKDGGIDGVAYAADRAALVFVQSKWTEDANTGISQGDVMKFVGGVRRVVNGDWSGFGGPILDRHAEIEDILYQTGTKIEIVVVTSGTSSSSKRASTASISLGRSAAVKPLGGGGRTICPWIGRSDGCASTVSM